MLSLSGSESQFIFPNSIKRHSSICGEVKAIFPANFSNARNCIEQMRFNLV